MGIFTNLINDQHQNFKRYRPYHHPHLSSHQPPQPSAVYPTPSSYPPPLTLPEFHSSSLAHPQYGTRDCHLAYSPNTPAAAALSLVAVPNMPY
ncbi:hypothetical protein K469DRAFT_715287 [Zopfia rhizophila CBS 207.26]|uniref:Uncharacterized protein n=1 Tax=Zopfia rhizophila CBS 207.26 TaxID=1314779 RepID=A0A6A6ET21_9PEZI|nr:hypothetical protein K469DRAFT_715287 [Zopfia rhizophila CBS 207.26]